MAKVAVHFLIPLREDSPDGTGALHPPFRWIALQNALEEAFDGWSVPDHIVEGAWRDPDSGTIVKDQSRPFEVDIPEERLEELRALLRRACNTFVQKCIRVVILGRAEYLEGARDHEQL